MVIVPVGLEDGIGDGLAIDGEIVEAECGGIGPGALDGLVDLDLLPQVSGPARCIGPEAIAPRLPAEGGDFRRRLPLPRRAWLLPPILLLRRRFPLFISDEYDGRLSVQV